MIKYSPTPDYVELKTVAMVGVSAIAVYIPVSNGASVNTTVDDAIIGDDDVAVIDNVWDVSPNIISNIEYESLTPSIATIDSTGLLGYVSNGTAQVLARIQGGETRKLSLVVSRSSGANLFQSWVVGSLANHVTDYISNLIENKTPTTETLNVFSTSIDTGTPTYIRNSNLFCDDLVEKITGCNVWQSDYGSGLTRAQTAITPRHIVGAAHYDNPITIGGTQRFVASDGTIVNRTVTHTYVVPGTDIQISLLSSDLPASITPISILPSNVRNYISQLQYGIPCILRNQYRELRLFDCVTLTGTNASFSSSTMRDGRSDWQKTLVIGDSGGPAMIPINGELALVTTWTGPGSGPSYHNRDWGTIISTLDALAGINTGYLPNIINLGSFPDY